MMRKTLLSAAALVAAGLLSGPASAQTPSVLGTPMAEQSLETRAELIRLADALDAAVDAKEWAAARSLFTDDIDVDFTSLVGGAPARIPADALIEGWSTNLNARKTSFHLRGNHRITYFGEDRATMLSHGYAWNRLEAGADPANGGDPLWEVWGVYEHHFVRTPEGWRIAGMTFVATAERGNPFVRDTIAP